MSNPPEQPDGVSEGQPSSWETTPCVISAIAILITAAGGLLVVFLFTDVFGASDGAGDPTEVVVIPTATEDPDTGGATATSDDGSANPTATDPPSFAEAVTGSYTLDSWVEATGPVTLFVEVLDGTLDIQPSGAADWLLSIQERGESASPQPQIRCGGQVTFAEQRLEGVPGGDRNGTIDFTADLSSIQSDLFLAFCGWNVTGEAAPFDLVMDTDGSGRKVLVMRNDAGTFRWIES